MDADTKEKQIAPGTERGDGDGRAEPKPPPGERPRLEVSGTQVVAGALASVSAAVVASYFGTAGTVAGTATASVVTTIGGALYSVGLRRTSARLRQTGSVLPIPPIRPALPRTRLDRWRAWMRQRRWGLAAGVGLVFVLALAVVTLVELVGQRPLSGIAHGNPAGTTSIGSIARGENDPGNGDEPDDPSPAGTTTTTVPDGTTTTTTPSTSTPTSSPGTSGPSTTTSPSTTTTAESPTTTAAEPPETTDQSTPTSAG